MAGKGVIGSPLSGPAGDLQPWVDQLYGQATDPAIDLSSQASLEAAHNRFTAYCLLLLQHATGHRPVLDPFCYPEQLGKEVAVIEDKAASPRHRFRLVALPGAAATQTRNYQDHLHRLIAHLAAADPHSPLADCLYWQTQRLARKRLVPFFFFLHRGRIHSTAPKEVATHANWFRPFNLHRHLLWDGLRAEGVPADIARLQMGHLEFGQSQFGPDSGYSPRDFAATLGPALANIMEHQGWVPAESPLPETDLPDSWGGGKQSLCESLRAQRHLGPEARARNRRSRINQVREVVAKLVDGHDPDTDSSHSEIGRLAEEAEASFPGDPELGAAARNQLLKTLLSRGFPIAHGRKEVIHGPPPPFTRNWPRSLGRAESLRQAFWDYLENQGAGNPPRPSPSVRLAEILITASFFGGMTRADRLRALPEAINKGAWAIGPWMVIDVKHPDSSEWPDHDEVPYWRWKPDELSEWLLRYWFTEYETSERKVPHPTLKAALRRILKSLGADKEEVRDPFAFLARMGSDQAIFQAPGYLRPFWLGHEHSSPLPRTALWRIAEDRAIHYKAATPDEAAESALPPAPTSTTIPDRPSAAARQFLAEWHRMFRDMRKAQGKGNARSAQRTHLRRQLEELRARGEQFPPVATALIQWAQSLLQGGASHPKKALAPSTVERYANSIARPVVELAANQPFFELDEEQLETLFQHTLEYTTKTPEKARWGAFLYYFHLFLQDQWGFGPIDWSFLPHTDMANYADAQLITAREYQEAFDRLWEDDPLEGKRETATQAQQDLSSHYAYAQTLYLILGYRFGLRAGEAISLVGADLELDKDTGLAVVHARTNAFGSLKSPAAHRTIPNLDTLGPREWEVLEKAQEWGREHPAAWGNLPIFNDPQTPDHPLGRSLLVQRVQWALRMASGEARIRYHHLRHSYAHRLFLGLLDNQAPSESFSLLKKRLAPDVAEPSLVRQLFTHSDRLTDETVSAFRESLGHTAFATSGMHYVHTLALTIADYGLRNPEIPTSQPLWAYLLGRPQSTIRIRLYRNEGNNPAKPAPTNLKALLTGLRGGPGAPQTKLPPLKQPSDLPSLEQLDEILCQARTIGSDPERVANSLGILPAQVEPVIKAALRVDDRWRWGSLRPPDSTDPEAAPGLLTALLHSTDRVRSNLRQLEGVLEKTEPDTLDRGLRVWEAKFDARLGCLLTRWQEVEDWLELGSALGYIKEIKLQHPEAPYRPSDHEMDRLRNDWHIPLEVVAKKGVQMRNRAPGDPQWVLLPQVMEGMGQWAYHRNLVRAHFLLSVRKELVS